MLNPNDPLQLRQFVSTVKASHTKLESYRQGRRELVRDFVGADYGSEGGQEMPVNMLALMVDVYLMYLAGSTPQVILPTPRFDILPFVADLEAVVNQELQDMKFAKSIRRWVQEAIFCMGVGKCGLVDSDYVEILPGEPQQLQEYFFDVIDFDDFVYDTDAKDWSRIGFIGDRYIVDYDAIMDNESYDERGKAALGIREEATRDEMRTSEIGMPEGIDELAGRTWRKTSYIWDVCIPEQRIVVTFADGDGVNYPLKVVDWDWPSTSPYKTLWFTDVPGNTMPLPPGRLMKSMNRSLNALYRKLVEQAKRQKTIGMFRHGEQDDAKMIQESNDGDLIPVSHPDTVKEVTFGGAAQENLAFAIQIRELFSMMAGNLDAMGGLGPQSDTARQDAMIQSTVSQKAAKMAEAVTEGTVEVLKDFVWHIWNDPLRTYSATRQVAGTDVQVAAQISPGMRFGNFSDLDVKIVPHSMRYRSPLERANDITQLMMNIVFPAMPFLQQQGISVDIQKLFEYLSKYQSLPELQHIFKFVGPPLPGTAGEEAKQPQVTNRTYTRVNRPGATKAGNDRTMQQLLMGGNPQSAQVASLGRPTGV